MNRSAHNAITQAFFPNIPKKLINAVNAALDAPSKTHGPSHRKFYHDPLSASLMGMGVAMNMGYPAAWGAVAAQMHLAEDSVSDRMRDVKLAPKVSLKDIFDLVTK